MNSKAISELLAIEDAEGLVDRLEVVVEVLKHEGADIEAVDAILHFMELHPDWDLGSPGPLVHFVERFYKKGYEEKLIASFMRFPTAHTAWMLHRIINGEKDSEKKLVLVNILVGAYENPTTISTAKQAIQELLR